MQIIRLITGPRGAMEQMLKVSHRHLLCAFKNDALQFNIKYIHIHVHIHSIPMCSHCPSNVYILIYKKEKEGRNFFPVQSLT